MKMKCMALASLLLILQVFLAEAASAKMYTWVDRNGVVRRTYYPPPPDQVMKKEPKQQAPASRKRSENRVELYVTSWCPYCAEAKQYFRSRGIRIKVYDIEKDRSAAQRKQQLDGDGGVPFAVVNGKPISGYSPEEYARALR
ncbi:MAG: glutaredoxin domain-containing protein [Desulfobulbaceae bacterium]